MTISQVQANNNSVTTGACAVVLGATPTVGNVLIMVIGHRNGVTGTTYGINNGTWTLVQRRYTGATAGEWPVLIYYQLVTGALSATTTVTPSLNNNMAVWIGEYAGVIGLDTSGGVDSFTTAATASFTPGAGKELLLISAAMNRNDTVTGVTWTAAGSMTEQFESTVRPPVVVNHQIVAAPSSGSYTVGSTGGSTDRKALAYASFSGQVGVHVTQNAVEVLVQSSAPNARVTQNATEVLVAPSTAKTRVTQLAVEVLVQVPPPTKARVTQLPVEAVVSPTSAKARLSQEVAEAVVSPTTGKARLSQEVAEVAVAPTTQKARVSQLVSEVAVSRLYPIESDLGFDYEIQAGAPVSADLTVDAAIATAVEAELEFDYEVVVAVGEPVSKDLTFSYAVTRATTTHQRGANLAFTYPVIAPVPVGTSYQFKFRIIEATHRGKSLTFAYPIVVKTVVGANLGFTYQVLFSPPVTVVGASLGINSAVLANTIVGANLGFTYGVEPPIVAVGSDLGFTYTVEPTITLVGANLMVAYGIDPSATTVGVDLDFDDEIAINVLAGADLGFGFAISINNLVGVDFNLDAPVVVFGQVGADLTFADEVSITNLVGVDFGFDAEIEPTISLVGVDLELDYEIVEPVPVGVDLDIDYDVEDKVTVGFDYTFDSEVEQATVPEPVVVTPRRGGRVIVIADETKPTFTVGSDLSFSYAIHSRVNAAYTLTAAVRALATTDWRSDYTVRNLITKGLDIDHDIVDWWDTNSDILASEIDDDASLIA